VGIATVAAAMGMTIWLSNVTDVTQYATNIITLIGIGVSIDYSLFLVNRFREELAIGRDVRTAVAMSTATAGKAVFFSGITVAIGLMGMLFFKNTSLPSLGIGGTVAVSIAMVYSTIVLPAVMSILGKRVDKGKVPFAFNLEAREDGLWANIANKVMAHPWKVLIPVLILLVGAGAPFLYAEFSLSSWSALPPDDESRLGKEMIDDTWPEQSSNQIFLVIELDGADVFEENNLRAQYQYIRTQISDDRVLTANGIGLPDGSMNESQVVSFWQAPDEYLNETEIALRNMIRDSFTNGDVTYIVLNLAGEQTSVASRNVVEDIRDDRHILTDQLSGQNDYLAVAGFAAYNADTLNSIAENLPTALAFIFIATSILIFIQVRSVIIPIKAIIMNILSVSASFGMLVWVFQWGYGDVLLNFTAQPIDAGNPVIMFCIVFGLSMDYEVLMLSRIHEEWERTGDNTLAVANGLQKTGGLITGAAAIMVVVFGSFGLSSVIILKQIGLGLALAILIDATLIRALVVPATMRLMGKWNWWTPSFLMPRKNNKEVTESE
ncbi:MAG: MMPL family transporter, partial [Candidatus Poseidoniales archaeon]